MIEAALIAIVVCLLGIWRELRPRNVPLDWTDIDAAAFLLCGGSLTPLEWSKLSESDRARLGQIGLLLEADRELARMEARGGEQGVQTPPTTPDDSISRSEKADNEAIAAALSRQTRSINDMVEDAAK